MVRGDAERRNAPAIWNTDWLVLRGLSRALKAMLAKAPRTGLAIDFGCGVQPYRSYITDHGLTYQGADFGGDADIVISPDGFLPSSTPTAQVILSLQVLEHVGDLAVYFAEISRVLADDGMLFLSTHGTWLYHPHPQDHRRWTRTGLTRDIEAHGFVVHDMQSIVGPLATTTLIRLTSFAWLLRRFPLIGGILANALAIVMNLRAMAEDRITPRQVRDDNGCVYLVRCTKRAQA